MDAKKFMDMDGLDIASLIKRREIKPIEAVQTSLHLLEKVNPSLNAVTNNRQEKIVKEAENLRSNGLFANVPIFLKDISQALDGDKLTSGSRLLANSFMDRDSHFVKRLRDSGVLFMGHTTTPEFGLKNITEPKLHGVTRNPWNLDYSPGGSSGGSAALVAAGVVPIAGASDGGGSIRIPASFTGLFGLKPTRGRTPVGPGIGRQWQGASIDFVLSRTVRDSAAMLDVLQVVQQEAAFQTPLYSGNYLHDMQQKQSKPLKVAFTTQSPVRTPVSDEATDAVMKLVRWLEDEGHDVEEQENDVDGIELMRNYFLMNSGEISAVIKRLENSIGREITSDDVEIETWILNKAGQSVSAAEFTTSLALWDKAAAQMAKFHNTYDLYITPATAFSAPKAGELTRSNKEIAYLLEEVDKLDKKSLPDFLFEMFNPSLTYTPFTQLANLTGQPAMSIPVHITGEGMPLGVQVMAPKGEELQLLKLAYQIEQTDLWLGMKGNPFYHSEEIQIERNVEN